MAGPDESRPAERPDDTGQAASDAAENRDPAGADRGPAGGGGPARGANASDATERAPATAAQPSPRERPSPVALPNPIEQRSRWLLRAYPAAYRRDRGDEIIATLLEATPDGRAWPRLRDARALAVGGLKARAAQNRQRSIATNLRVAVMVGLTLYYSLWVSTSIVGVITGLASWRAVLSGVLITLTVLLAWSGSRLGVLLAALAGSVVIIVFGRSGTSVEPFLVEALGLVGLAVLTRRGVRPSWRWLWLPGVIIATSALVETAGAFLWLSYALSQFALLPILVFAVAALAWMIIDARLIVGVLTFLAAMALQVAASELSYGGAGLSWLPFPLIIAALLVSSMWVLRRQSARPVRTA
jgi:hypothetical protein